MMSVRRGQQVKRGRCGSSNMANMFQRKCLLQYLIIFPRSPDSVPHSHAGANLVHGDLKLIVKILHTISYQSLKRKKILVLNFMRLFHGDHNISWL